MFGFQSEGKKLDPGIERFNYIPLRLSDQERKYLTVLESALEVCEYTDNVDVVFSHSRKPRKARIIDSLNDILSISSGLIVAANSAKGEALIKGKVFIYLFIIIIFNLKNFIYICFKSILNAQ